MQEQVNIVFDLRRCPICGRHWALERFTAGRVGTCPYCAEDGPNESAELATAAKTIAALRGVITKMKKRSGR